ncbi:MAG TPA: hypothetical protein VJQ54_06330 [Candidatus Sulfotelmatobacter sp.]|nr:hypothetical protein [Candidatus Sulfotelmatobacter sp.]
MDWRTWKPSGERKLRLSFKKIIDHRGIDPVGVEASLALLGLGRAYMLTGGTGKGKVAYQDFLALWKDADPDIPILKEARQSTGSCNSRQRLNRRPS